MTRLAIMQPYFFPYLGYWQLMKVVDKFVIYNDVNYITRGWINRNRILVHGKPQYVTVPLRHASQNRLISETELHTESNWRDTVANTISQSYRKAPFFSEVFPIVEKIVRYPTGDLTEFLTFQLRILARQLGIETQILSSEQYVNREFAGVNRILDICKREHASIYINAPGGRALYDSACFANQGIELRFLEIRDVSYPQRQPGFVPHLSIVDVLMALGFTGTRQLLDECDVVS